MTLKRMTGSNSSVSLKKNNVISPIITRSAFNIPNSPEYISKTRIENTTNIYKLIQLEHDYDEFLDKKYQILMLLNIIDEVLEVRDQLICRINTLRRQERQRQMRDNNRVFMIKC